MQTEFRGTVVGHTAKLLAQRHVCRSKIETSRYEARLVACVQMFADNRLIFVQCPINTACVVLHESRNPTLEEVQSILETVVRAYPLGAEATLIRKEYTRQDGQPGDPYYVFKYPQPINRLPLAKLKDTLRSKQQQAPRSISNPVASSHEQS